MRKFSRLVIRDKDSRSNLNGASSSKPDTSPSVARRGRSYDAIASTPGIAAWVDPALLQKTTKRGSHAATEALTVLIDAVKDYQINHGSLIKLVRTEEEATILARPIGAALYPRPFPRRAFDSMRRLQPLYNELYTAVATDARWLAEALRPLLTPGSFTSKLWAIHEQVLADGGYRQEMSMGIFRSDYMLHLDPRRPQDPAAPKQVEFNTFSCAGLAHGARVAAMHRHLARAGFYAELEDTIPLADLPACDNVAQVVAALVHAHGEYNRQFRTPPAKTGVLMIVQPLNVNVVDERPVEYGCWDADVPCYHVVWGAEFARCTTLGLDGTLRFHPPGRAKAAATAVEIAVVYHRAGYDEEEYATAAGVECRLRCERSRAIKCPSVLGHLAGFKMVQQALASPGALLRFLSPDKASRIVDSFAPMYPLDATSNRGRRGRELARSADLAANHILKPSLEGGGHNIYGRDIPAFLQSMPESEWETFILMERIHPPDETHVLIGPRGLHSGAVESELGIVGTCLWHNHPQGDTSPEGGMAWNRSAGWTLKTKAKGVDEMSVIKGYGCFDSPVLVNG